MHVTTHSICRIMLIYSSWLTFTIALTSLQHRRLKRTQWCVLVVLDYYYYVCFTIWRIPGLTQGDCRGLFIYWRGGKDVVPSLGREELSWVQGVCSLLSPDKFRKSSCSQFLFWGVCACVRYPSSPDYEVSLQFYLHIFIFCDVEDYHPRPWHVPFCARSVRLIKSLSCSA